VEVQLRILYSQKTKSGLDVRDGSNVIYGWEHEQSSKLWLMSVNHHLWNCQRCVFKSTD
jgi:hypothetical protein